MLEYLHQHNNPEDFEVCYTWDSRLEDGSREVLEELKTRYLNFKVTEFGKQDATNYFDSCLSYYDSRNIFPSSFRSNLRETLELYKGGEYPEVSNSFLWVSLGPLYNRAIQISSGDILVVAPVDMIHLFTVKDIYSEVITNKEYCKTGRFYKKPNALFTRITNLPKEVIEFRMAQVQQGQVASYRWDHPDLFLSLFHTPSDLKDVYLPHFAGNRSTSLDDPNFPNEARSYCKDVINLRPTETQWLQQFHGFHIMSKKFYDKVGGFTEEYYYRALPDDKMTYHGRAFNSCEMPAHMSTGWVGHFAYEPDRLSYPPNHVETYRAKEPYADVFLSRQGSSKGYALHSRSYTDSYVHQTLLPQFFSTTKPPVRLVT